MGNVFSRIKEEAKKEAWNDILHELKHIVTRITRGKLGRDPTDDEVSIALSAVHDAIKSFDETKNRNAGFIGYAGKVIQNRLIDFFREEKKRKKCTVLHPNVSLFVDQQSFDEYRTKQFNEDLHQDIMKFTGILGNIGYTLGEMQENKPKRRDAREKLKNIAAHIVELGLGERYIKENPLSRELGKLIGIDRRILRKYRPYLCGLIIVLLYFPAMRTYIGFSRKEIKNGN